MRKWFKPKATSEPEGYDRRRGERRWASAAASYDETVQRYRISPNADSFIAKGYDISSPKEMKNYIDGYVRSLIKLIQADIQEQIVHTEELVKAELGIVERQIAVTEEELSRKKPEGFLAGINEELRNARERAEEIEASMQPERRLYKLLGPVFEKLNGFLSQKASAAANSADTLKEVLARKVAISEAELLLHRGKELTKKAILHFYSSLYPPKLGYILFFYAVCLILSVAEIGFSIRILRNIINVASEFEIHGANLYFGILYGVAMTLTFAVLAKTSFDVLSIKTEMKIRPLVISAICAFLIQTIFYSIPKVDGETFWTNLPAGIPIGFFSVLFAVANALLFKETANLHGAYSELNGKTGVAALTKKKNAFEKAYTMKLSALKDDKISLTAEIAYYKGLIAQLPAKMSHLEEISAAAVNQGFGKKLEEIIRDGKELQMMLHDKLKK